MLVLVSFAGFSLPVNYIKTGTLGNAAIRFLEAPMGFCYSEPISIQKV